MFVLNAKNSHDVDVGHNIVEVITTQYFPGTGWNNHTDFLYTNSKGNWSELSFKKDEYVSYESFLNSMVEKNLEVCRKIAQVSAERIVNGGSWSDFVKLMRSLTILDDTFTPPYINLRCRWQREFLESICNTWVRVVISTCHNMVNLTHFAKEIDSF